MQAICNNGSASALSTNKIKSIFLCEMLLLSLPVAVARFQIYYRMGWQLSVSGYKLLGTSLYFISTNLHTELKPQVNVSHDMNYPAFTLYKMGVGKGTEGILPLP